MNNFEITISTYGRYEYYLDETQKLMCANEDTEKVATDIFSEFLNPGSLENIEMIKFLLSDDYMIIYVVGYYNIYVNADSIAEAKEEAICMWEEADFGNLEDLEILKINCC